MTQTVYTHNGKFHADEVFATAVLKLAIGNNLEVIRTRNITENILQNYIVYDVGNSEFDHHAGDDRQHEDGTPMASFGLIWNKYGTAAVNNVLAENKPSYDIVSKVLRKTEKRLIISVDAADNGIDQTGFTVSDIISDTSDFDEAVAMALTILKNRIIKAYNSAVSEELISKTFISLNDETILLPESGSWKFLVEEMPNLKYIIYKGNNENYNIQAAPINKDSMVLRKELSDDLTQQDGFVFLHKNKFLAVFETLEQAIIALHETK